MKKTSTLSLFFLSLFIFSDLIAQNTTVDQLIGVNTLSRDPVDEELKNFAHVREFHLWAGDQGYIGEGDPSDDCESQSDPCCPEPDFKWNPGKDPLGYQGFDDYYSAHAGKIFPAMAGSAPAMAGLTGFTGDLNLIDQKPACPVDGENLQIKNSLGAVSPVYDLSIPPVTDLPNVFWFEPLYGIKGGEVEFVLKAKNIEEVSEFTLTFGYGTGYLVPNENPTVISSHPNVNINVTSSDGTNNFLTTISGTINGTVENNDVLVRFKHLIQTNLIGFIPLSIDLPDYTIMTTNTSEDPIFPETQLNILKSNELAIFSIIDDVAVTCNSTQICYPLKTVNFKDITEFDFNFSWDKSLIDVYQGILNSNVAVTVSPDNDLGEAIISKSGTISKTLSDGNLSDLLTICLDTDVACDPQNIPLGSISSAPSGASPYSLVNNPERWREHALWVSAMAMRYGGNANHSTDRINKFFLPMINDADLLKAESNPTGLGVLTYFENQNEPDKNWIGNPTAGDVLTGNSIYTFSPQQYAAMSSVDYDGHNNQVKYIDPSSNEEYDIGLIFADPEAKFVMGGLAGLKDWYVIDMLNWFKANRNVGADQFPFDVINLHHYCTDATVSGNVGEPTAIQLGKYAVSPEEDGLKEKLEATLSSLTAYPELADKEYWITEFGFDTNPLSSLAAVPARTLAGVDLRSSIGTFNSLDDAVQDEIASVLYKTQADWTVRYWLAMAAADVGGKRFSRGTFHTIIDTDNTGAVSSAFSSGGLLKFDGSPKKSWYWVLTLQEVLSGYTFEKEVVGMGCGDTRVYKFTGSGEDIYAVWDTGSDGEEQDCVLDFSNEPVGNLINVNETTLITFKDLDENGVRKKLSEVSNISVAGKIISDFKVTETPQFLIFGEGISDEEIPCIPVYRNFTNLDCNIIAVNWLPPFGGVEFEKFNVYIKPFEGETTAPDFDLGNRDISLVAANIPGGTKTINIPEFWELCDENWVYVIGITEDGRTSEACGYLIHGTRKCQACAVDVANDFTVTSDAATDCLAGSANDGDINSLFALDDLGNLCRLESYAAPTTAWNNTGKNKLILSVNSTSTPFEKRAKINYVRFFDAGDQGRLMITLFDENNVAYEMANYVTNADPFQWITLSNTAAPDELIVRVEIERSDCGVDIKKFIFCGEVKEKGEFFASPLPPSIAVTETWKNATEVNLKWDAVDKVSGVSSLGRASTYTISSASEVDEDGHLIDPIMLALEVDESLTELEYVLKDDELGGERIQIDPCNTCPEIVQFPSLPIPRMAGMETTFEVFLSPNPSSGSFTVQSIGNELGLKSIQLYSSDGIPVATTKRAIENGSFTVNTASLNPGLYLCKITAVNGTVIVKKVVLVNQD